MTTFDTAMATFAALDEDRLGRPWSWRGATTDVRYALYRTLEDAQVAVVETASARHPESRRILALAQGAFGDLRGLLVGLPSEWLDRAPRDGEWPLRETLRHMLAVERRYALQTLYALERGDADPIRIPEERLPKAAAIDVNGDIAAVLARFAEARDETNRRLADVPAAGMTRPTQWITYDVDVRFRLHRFAAHVAEHTIQCAKTLAALGWRETEGRRIVRRVWSLVGELEGLGAVAALRTLASDAAERAATVS